LCFITLGRGVPSPRREFIRDALFFFLDLFCTSPLGEYLATGDMIPNFSFSNRWVIFAPLYSYSRSRRPSIDFLNTRRSFLHPQGVDDPTGLGAKVSEFPFSSISSPMFGPNPYRTFFTPLVWPFSLSLVSLGDFSLLWCYFSQSILSCFLFPPSVLFPPPSPLLQTLASFYFFSSRSFFDEQWMLPFYEVDSSTGGMKMPGPRGLRLYFTKPMYAVLGRGSLPFSRWFK